MNDRITPRDLDLHGKWRRVDMLNADLFGADLCWANLSMANLSGARLSMANLYGANLSGSDLSEADLYGANLVGADLSRTRLSGVNWGERWDRVPVLNKPHVRLLELLSETGNVLDMDDWHTCDTVHCWAGWLVTMAGDEGRALDAELGASAAAALIVVKSCPHLNGVVPDWHQAKAEALVKIREYAELEAAE